MSFQVQSLRTQRIRYYKVINQWAEHNAKKLWYESAKPNAVSCDLLKQISAIYYGAKVENELEPSDAFSAAYHTPITGDLEYLIARTLFYFGNPTEKMEVNKHLEWTVYLRRQKKVNGTMVVPDIRIEKDGNTIGIIEIKARVGWMQPFFSIDTFEKDLINSKYDPNKLVKNANEQLYKYIDGFGLQENKTSTMFMLVPSLEQAHRKTRKDSIDKFKETFRKHSGLKDENLVVLTHDLEYDAGMIDRKTKKPKEANSEKVSSDFETMVQIIRNNSLEETS